jgi:YcaO cyclodehydratase, ATP-ad Mg2+-binding
MIATAKQKWIGHHESSSSLPAFPFAYESIQISTGSRPIGFRFSKFITDIAAVLDGREIVVCGESFDHDNGMDKAISELIERSALLVCGPQYFAETSNGWAAHPKRDQARTNAILELVERDAVLAQWYSRTPFRQLPTDQLPSSIRDWARSELSKSEFPILKILISTQGLGPSVTCLLQNSKGLGVSAHSTRATLDDSIESAIAEACRAAHLSIRRAHWKDTLKLKDGAPGIVDPSAHALYYAYHEPFPSWMFGATERHDSASSEWCTRIKSCLESDDFVFQSVMTTPTNVGFARHPSALTLHWQATKVNLVLQENGIKRLNLKPETINEKPHIVS